jgi:hypothetical protein
MVSQGTPSNTPIIPLLGAYIFILTWHHDTYQISSALPFLTGKRPDLGVVSMCTLTTPKSWSHSADSGRLVSSSNERYEREDMENMVQENGSLDDQESNQQEVYQIKVRGVLGEEWSNWFDGMAVAADDDDPLTTTITCSIIDQAALHGILSSIRDLNLKLISVFLVEADKHHQPGGE